MQENSTQTTYYQEANKAGSKQNGSKAHKKQCRERERGTGAHERGTRAPGKQSDNKHYVKLHYKRTAQFVER